MTFQSIKISEHQDFLGNRPPALRPPRTVAPPFSACLGMIRLLLKKNHDFIYLNDRTELLF